MNTYYLAPRVRYDQFTTKLGYPVYLRFSTRNEQGWLALGIYIKDKAHWNDRIKRVVDGSNFKLKNDAIVKHLNDAEARILNAIANGDGPTLRAFKGKSLENFEEYMKQICKDNPDHVKGTVKAIVGCCKKVPDITQVNARWLRLLNDYMISVGLAQNSRKNYMGGVLRKTLKQAVREGFIVKEPDYDYPKEEEVNREYLNSEERLTFFNAMLKRTFSGDLHMTLVYFMLGCYSGLRYIDWTRFDIKKHVEKAKIGNMIILRAKKNGTRITMPVQPGLQKVLDEIAKIGRLSVSYDMMIKHLKTISLELELNKEIGTHAGRHSFGYMCACEGVSKESTAYFMGITIKVVDVYYHLTGNHANEQIKKLKRA